MKQKKTLWRLIAKSLGEKAGKTDEEADKIAIIRLLMFLSIFITNSFIVYGVLRTHHFPTNNTKKVEVHISGSCLSQYEIQSASGRNKSFEFE